MITVTEGERIVSAAMQEIGGGDREMSDETLCEWATGQGIEPELVIRLAGELVGVVPIAVANHGLSPEQAVASVVISAFIQAWSLADSRVPDSAMPDINNVTQER